MDDGSLTIQWGDNTQYIDHCILSYVNQSGQTVSRNVLPSEMLTEINDYSSDLSLTTLFMLIPPSEIFRLDVITPALVESLPFKGPHIFSASAICEIAVRDFDFGGEGLAFHDSNTNNDPGGSYRADNGDPAGVAADIEGGGNTGYTNAGEWLVYTVEVQDEGLYAADVLLSVNSGDGGAFSISVDGNKSEKTVAPNNSNWSDWRWVFERYPDLKSTQSKFYLTAGKHKVRFSYESGGFNLMALRFTNISGSGVPSITPFSSWSFEDPSDLAKANVNSGIQGIPLGLFGNITPVEGPSPTNKAVRIDAGSSNYLKVFHGMLPSDAGYVADWTMMVVFKIPELDRWRTILQTDITPAGDADFFVRDNGQIGVGAIGYYGPALEAGNWYRLIISRQNAFVTSHVNGIQYHNYANGGDNRFNLLEAFLVSQDEDGEDGIIDIAEIAVWNVPLNEAQRALIETEQQNK
jgi:hypothetical protein